MKKFERKVFEYLKEVGVIDILKVVLKMEEEDNVLVEDIFLNYIYVLFKEGIESGDIFKWEFFE